ncbi:hypothetical protein BC628DRAFT_1385200 [Trametes gibbosa]|nr:hypothetical protein BC628DRAFT_1385200 [Trametes gibbosa]
MVPPRRRRGAGRGDGRDALWVRAQYRRRSWSWTQGVVWLDASGSLDVARCSGACWESSIFSPSDGVEQGEDVRCFLTGRRGLDQEGGGRNAFHADVVHAEVPPCSPSPARPFFLVPPVSYLLARSTSRTHVTYNVPHARLPPLPSHVVHATRSLAHVFVGPGLLWPLVRRNEPSSFFFFFFSFVFAIRICCLLLVALWRSLSCCCLRVGVGVEMDCLIRST